MIEVTVELGQDDCPFIDTTTDGSVSFSTVNWEFDQVEQVSESRVVMEGGSNGAVDDGLHLLREHPNTVELELLSRRGAVAHLHARVAETEAMNVVRSHGGFITGPFHTSEMRETWHIGFDREAQAEATISALDDQNSLAVLDRRRMTPEDVDNFAQNVGAAMTLVEGAQELSDVERRTLEKAVNEGYFSRPRGVDLGDLASDFDVSKPAVSKNLRRGQEKLLERVVDALKELR
ncbi:MAG: helix-turn-helix domain-containing protein [Halodesulfurarchaeum sp.]